MRSTTTSTQKPALGSGNSSPGDTLRLESWTTDPSPRSGPRNSETSPKSTSSPESAGGRLLFGGQVGPTNAPSGPAPARVSRFRARDSEKAMPTNDTCGPLFTLSSPSVSLQVSLENRLRARMGANGSQEFELTWKELDMPSGPPICALRASERRTAGRGCSGWPTPQEDNANNAYGHKGTDFSDLPTTAQLAGWPTPAACDASSACNSTATRHSIPPTGIHAGNTLTDAAKLVGWATPRAEDAESAGMRHSRGVADTLSAQAGQDLKPSIAGTEKRAALNPAHSRWLMGYPAAWDSCGATAMQSSRKSLRNSSKPS